MMKSRQPLSYATRWLGYLSRDGFKGRTGEFPG